MSSTPNGPASESTLNSVSNPATRFTYSGRSRGLPGGTDALIGVDNPDHGFRLGEDGLSEFIDQISSGAMRFTITVGAEVEAERHPLNKGLVLTGFGVVFALIPVAFVMVL